MIFSSFIRNISVHKSGEEEAILVESLKYDTFDELVKKARAVAKAINRNI